MLDEIELGLFFMLLPLMLIVFDCDFQHHGVVFQLHENCIAGDARHLLRSRQHSVNIFEIVRPIRLQHSTPLS